MYIIKKDGRIQKFNENKIITSIKSAARDVNTILNEADIAILIKDIKNIIKIIRKDNSNTSSYEIMGIIIQVLNEDKFTEILKSYTDFYNNK